MHDKLEIRTFLLCLLIVTVIFGLLLKPFFGTIFWACALAVIFAPLQERLLKRWPHRPNTAALITLGICMLVLVLPMALVISAIVSQGIGIFSQLQSGEINPAHYIESINTAFPALPELLTRFGINIDNIKSDAINTIMNSSKVIAAHAFTIGSNAFAFIASLVMMLYIAFFMLRDGDKLVELLIRALPLGDTRERQLFSLFAEVTRATIKGNILIALLQGFIGGVTLALLGVKGALLLGGFMALASLIPAVGSALIWVPVAIYLAAVGQTTSALILAGVGAGIIGMLDNVLRPILVGRDTKLPDYLVLLSTLGGIGLFGMNGFIIGPLIAALFIAFWGIFIQEIHFLAPDENANEDETSEDIKQEITAVIENSDEPPAAV